METPVPLRPIPLLDLMAFLIETPDAPTHVGVLQVYRPVKGTRRAILGRILRGFRAAPVAPPFDCVPLFPPFARPQWARPAAFDPDYHIRRLALPSPGTREQLLELVMREHAGMLDRTRPGWIAYLIDGLEHERFAIYWKVHHAYIDGASAAMRFEAIAARTPQDLRVRAVWSPLFDEPAAGHGEAPAGAARAGLAAALQGGVNAASGLARLLGRNLLQAQGQLQRAAPLPFSAPHSLFNAPVHAARRLGLGSIALERLRAMAKASAASINDVALTITGAALEQYAQSRGERPARALVAICPMSIRRPGDTSASTQFAAIPVRLGDPDCALPERLRQVSASARDAKEDARSVPREALIAWLALVGGSADLLAKSPFAGLVPPTTNVNISNVAGPAFDCYYAGAELEGSFPVSTLAGGAAINVTFASTAGRMDYAVLTDALAIPDPQQIADAIAAATAALEQALFPPVPPRRAARSRKSPTPRRGKSA